MGCGRVRLVARTAKMLIRGEARLWFGGTAFRRCAAEPVSTTAAARRSISVEAVNSGLTRNEVPSVLDHLAEHHLDESRF
jgi:hypothetical protein